MRGLVSETQRDLLLQRMQKEKDRGHGNHSGQDAELVCEGNRQARRGRSLFLEKRLHQDTHQGGAYGEEERSMTDEIEQAFNDWLKSPKGKFDNFEIFKAGWIARNKAEITDQNLAKNKAFTKYNPEKNVVEILDSEGKSFTCEGTITFIVENLLEAVGKIDLKGKLLNSTESSCEGDKDGK